MSATLALDLGQKTGWAHQTTDGMVTSGTWDMSLSPKRRKDMDDGWERREDPRFIDLWVRIDRMIRQSLVSKVVFEDVQFSTYTYQTQLWASFRAAVWAQRILHMDVVFGCLNTATLKLVSTGSGNATKAMMAAWAVAKYPEYFRKLIKPDVKKDLYIETLDGRPVDDNEVDAFHLLKYFTKDETK